MKETDPGTKRHFKALSEKMQKSSVLGKLLLKVMRYNNQLLTKK